MRPKWFLSLLVAAAVAVAGCSDEENGHDDCPEGHEDEHCPPATDTGTGTDGPDQNATPNEPPVLVLTVTDAAGNETPVTTPGGSLTFSAMGSSDPDGEITGIAVTVEDSNGTRTQSLFADGAFDDATFIFEAPGRVGVTISLVDDDAAFTTETSAVYVNEPQVAGNAPHQFSGAHPTADPTTCAGPVDPLADSNVWKRYAFQVRPGATFVEVTTNVTHPSDPAGQEVDQSAGSVTFAICDPTGEPISEAASDTVTTAPGTAFNASLDYYVSAYSRAPGTSAGFDVVVHYEPDGRAQ